VSPTRAPEARGGSAFTFALLLAATIAFGFVGGLAEFVGPVVGAAGVVASAVLRRRYGTAAPAASLLPVLAALGVLAAAAAPVTSAELLGGVAALALLLWIADDPSRPAGGGRRALRTIGASAAALGIAFGLFLALPALPSAVGVAGGLLAFVLLFLAVLLERFPRTTPGRRASA
jgi:hypothetical protein